MPCSAAICPYLIKKETCVILCGMGNQRAKAAYLSYSLEGIKALRTKEGRAMPMYVTYTDLIQVGIFIVALVGLCHTIFMEKRK